MELASVFSEGAVLQQKMIVPVWGTAAPETLIQGTLAGQETFCRAASNGDFILYFPALESGGPYELVVQEVDSGCRKVVRDILIGEVWLASGQSNMEYTLETNWAVSSPEAESGKLPVNYSQKIEFQQMAGKYDRFRFLSLGKEATGAREKTIKARWQALNAESCLKLSAVAAWFGKALSDSLEVPVGLIVSAWGGTIAEAWTSRAGLLSNPDTRPMIEEYDSLRRKKKCWCRDLKAAFDEMMRSQTQPDPGNRGVEWGWASPDLDDGDWQEMKIPGSWIGQKLSGNGAVWVRKTVEIPPEWAGRELVLHLGGVDKLDTAYFNGVEIGRTGGNFDTEYWDVKRRYAVPAGCVRPGRNVIAVRGYSFVFDGSFNGQPDDYRLSFPDDSGSIMLASPWKFRAELNLGVVQIKSTGQTWGPDTANTPGILFDSMIAPLFPYAVRGVIWYQGESNAYTAEEAGTYRRKLKTMIEDWRYNWERPDLPFIQMELANFREHRPMDPESSWAILREQQHGVMADLPDVYMATAVDIGEAADIHPQNKKTAGTRMAAAAVCHVYHHAGDIADGPRFRDCRFEKDGSAWLSFDYARNMKLTEAPGESFFIAGRDRCFYPAESAEISGEYLVLSSPAVKNPVAVRYAWADNPASILYNEAGLPASPFRTDCWEPESVTVKI